MKVYFACSLTGGRQDQPVYQAIVEALLADGHQVPTAALAEPEALANESARTPDEVYRRDTAWIESCDALVAEVSAPSHGVGYEVGYALQQGMPVLCCYRQGVKVSKMILGNPDPHLRVKAYQDAQEAVKAVRGFLAEIVSG